MVQRDWNGAVLSARQWLNTLTGRTVAVPDERRLIHLQFRRFAGCPVCNLHLHTFARRHTEIEEAGVREVVVFHSSAAELQPHTGDLPFDIVPDPDKRLYAAYGVESSVRAMLDPRAWMPILIAILHATWRILRGRAQPPGLRPHGGRWGLPADFLIASDGRIVASRYGGHADDHWSVDEVLELARAASDGHASARSATASRLLSQARASAMAVLLLTIVHHAYGAMIYDAPFRSHVILVAVPLGILIASLLHAGRRVSSSRAARIAVALAVTLILLLAVTLGFYEGGYNHLVKNIVWLGGASAELMRTLYPGSLYEMPNNAFFEITGVLQLPVAMIAGRDAVRLALRLRESSAPGQSANANAVTPPRIAR